MLKTIALECKIIFKNGGVVLILILAPIIYATLYSSCYESKALWPTSSLDRSHCRSQAGYQNRPAQVLPCAQSGPALLGTWLSDKGGITPKRGMSQERL